MVSHKGFVDDFLEPEAEWEDICKALDKAIEDAREERWNTKGSGELLEL